LVRPNRLVAVAWLLAWPISTLTLNGWPHIGYCVGLSGVLHAGVVIMGLFMLLDYFQPPHLNRNGRIWGGLLLMGISLKLFSEESWHLPVVWDNAANLSVVRAIHLTGAVSGMALTLAVIAIHAIIFKFLYRLRRQSQLGDV
jgi:hypothetical protein